MNHSAFRPVVDFEKGKDKLFSFDFTGALKEPDSKTIADAALFSDWVNKKLEQENCRYGIGGYKENRILYVAKNLFDEAGEARSLHLGTDIWGPAGTAVYAPADAELHSFRFNEGYGNYGATIILKHDHQGEVFHTLYGHLSLSSLEGLPLGMKMSAGTRFATFGIPEENGFWPPHLHFQVILDMKEWKGDYPGVCKFSEQDEWLKNSPDPDVILKYTFA